MTENLYQLMIKFISLFFVFLLQIKKSADPYTFPTVLLHFLPFSASL